MASPTKPDLSIPSPPVEDYNFRALVDLDEPVFLLNAPFSLDTKIANNATMDKLDEPGRHVDRARAFSQWRALYHHLASRSLVYLLPSRAGLQDQPYVANLGVVIDAGEDPVFVPSRFRALGRRSEPALGRSFFKSLGVATPTCPAYFEGEADLKRLRDNIYFGGHGLRSSRRAHHWLTDHQSIEVVPVPLHDPHLFHLDCVIHVVSRDRVLVAAAACQRETIRQIEAYAEIIDVPLALAYRGATNVARVGSEILCDSCLPGLTRSDALYSVEKEKRDFWLKLAPDLGLEPVFFDLSEFYKSGAMLSCLVLPLNYPHLRGRMWSPTPSLP